MGSSSQILDVDSNQFSVPCPSRFQIQKTRSWCSVERPTRRPHLSFSLQVQFISRSTPCDLPHIHFSLPTMPSLPSLPSTSSSSSSPLATSSAVTGSQAAKQIAWQAALYIVVTLGSVYVIRTPLPRSGSPSPHPLSSFLFTNSHRRHLRRPHPAHLERRCTKTESST